VGGSDTSVQGQGSAEGEVASLLALWRQVLALPTLGWHDDFFANGGHSLKAVCARELGIALPKDEQTSDWTTRPLTPTQLTYAALDAELLLRLLPLL
jgi:hypothetical protein